jgi:serine/threonine protein kinase
VLIFYCFNFRRRVQDRYMRSSNPIFPTSSGKRQRDDAPLRDAADMRRRYRCLTPPAEGEAPGEAGARRLQKEDPLFDVGYVTKQLMDYHIVVERARSWLAYHDRHNAVNEGDQGQLHEELEAGPARSSSGNEPICIPSPRLVKEEREYIAEILRRRLPPSTEAFNERYRRLLKIGEGTYGDVFIVYDTQTQQHLAMKRLRNLFHDPNHSQLVAGVHVTIIQELKMLQVLDHKNVLKLIDFHFMEMGVCVLLLPLVTHDMGGVVRWWRKCYQEYANIHLNRPTTVSSGGGTGIAEQSKRRVEEIATASREGRMPLSQIKCLLHQLLTAVAYLHEKAVWHRDLKMSNLMIHHDGTVVVVDFGWSRFEPYNLVVGRKKHEQETREKQKLQKQQQHAPPSAPPAPQEQLPQSSCEQELQTTGAHRASSVAAESDINPVLSRGPIPTPMRSRYASGVSSVQTRPSNSPSGLPQVMPRTMSVNPVPKLSRREGPALTGPVGTVNYRAPEVLIGSPSSRYYDGYAVDLWAVGCIAYELIVGELLLPGRGLTDMEALQRLLTLLGAPYEPRAKLQWPQCSLISGTTEAILAISEAQQKQLSKMSSQSSGGGTRGRSVSNSSSSDTFEAHAVLKRTISDCVKGEDGVDPSATALDFLLQFLKWNPLHRVSAKHALLHPWLTTTQPAMCKPSELYLPPTNTYSFLASRR